MKIIIPSKGRPDIISTHLLFKDYPYTVVVHNNEEKSYYLMNKTIDPSKIVVADVPFGVARMRNWIQDNLIDDGEWYISLDDNIKKFTGVQSEKRLFDKLDCKKNKSLRADYETEIKIDNFLGLCDGLVRKGEAIGAYNIGFATVENYYFRETHYRVVGYVSSKACIRKNVGIRFDEENETMEDYAYTAECLKRFGKVLIDNFIYPVANHYQKGGIGTYDERLPKKIKDSASLIDKYQGLFANGNKRSVDSMGELRIRFTKPEQVEKWIKSF